jgi:hypothetical protein
MTAGRTIIRTPACQRVAGGNEQAVLAWFGRLHPSIRDAPADPDHAEQASRPTR